ncbi:MAG TPA: DUF1579 family protein [Candidatus Polarisedimenticolia bacterium]|jgi:hypothetical protein
MTRNLDRLILAVTFAASLPAGAATPVEAPAQDVLRRHVAARGGAERWRAIGSMEITGRQTTFSAPGAFRILRRRPNLYRFEGTVLKRAVVEAYDGSTSWWISPLTGNGWPLPAPLPHATIIAREAEFDTPLMAYPEGGHKVTPVGLTDFEGQRAWRIEVTRGDGSREDWYLDPNTFLEIARVSTTADFGQEMEKRSYFSDFHDHGGLLIPHRIDMEYGTRNEVLEVENVRLNVAAGDELFRMPAPEGMEALKPLAGEWNLKIETRAYPRAPWVAKEASSTITRLLDGGLLEERFTHMEQGLPVEVVRTWSYDRFRGVYRITHADNFAFHQNVLEGTLSQGRLSASNEKSGTAQTSPEGTVHNRIIASEIGPGGFKVDWESSTDGGATWTTDVKYTYTRR